VLCSSFESQLSAYVEGELGPVATARVARHLAGCAHCTAVAAELRSIEGLLLTTREPEPAPNFSSNVMAEVRALPAPHVRRGRPFAVLTTYVIFAWTAIATFLLFGGAAARAMPATFAALSGRFGQTAGALASATGRLFGRHTFDVTAAMGALLALDLIVAGVVIALVALRGRRTAPLGGPKSW